MKLELQDKELDMIYQALAAQPWGVVNPLMVNISQQIALQGQPPAATLSPRDEEAAPPIDPLPQ